MSAKSRGRHRFYQNESPDPAMSDEDKQDLEDVVDALELAEVNPRAGISKWVGAALGARDRAAAGRGGGNDVSQGAEPSSGAQGGKPDSRDQPVRALREPSPFEKAILGGMARKPMYGGTVEPWRVDARRRRNRAARKARRVTRLAHR